MRNGVCGIWVTIDIAEYGNGCDCKEPMFCFLLFLMFLYYLDDELEISCQLFFMVIMMKLIHFHDEKKKEKNFLNVYL